MIHFYILIEWFHCEYFFMFWTNKALKCVLIVICTTQEFNSVLIWTSQRGEAQQLLVMIIMNDKAVVALLKQVDVYNVSSLTFTCLMLTRVWKVKVFCTKKTTKRVLKAVQTASRINKLSQYCDDILCFYFYNV